MATVIARPLELDLLCQKLDADYANRITGTGNTPESRRSNYLSKAIAAFVLHEDAGAVAAAAVAQDGAEVGIDDVLVDALVALVFRAHQQGVTGERGRHELQLGAVPSRGGRVVVGLAVVHQGALVAVVADEGARRQ